MSYSCLLTRVVVVLQDGWFPPAYVALSQQAPQVNVMAVQQPQQQQTQQFISPHQQTQSRGVAQQHAQGFGVQGINQGVSVAPQQSVQPGGMTSMSSPPGKSGFHAGTEDPFAGLQSSPLPAPSAAAAGATGIAGVATGQNNAAPLADPLSSSMPIGTTPTNLAKPSMASNTSVNPALANIFADASGGNRGRAGTGSSAGSGGLPSPAATPSTAAPQTAAAAREQSANPGVPVQLSTGTASSRPIQPASDTIQTSPGVDASTGNTGASASGSSAPAVTGAPRLSVDTSAPKESISSPANNVASSKSAESSTRSPESGKIGTPSSNVTASTPRPVATPRTQSQTPVRQSVHKGLGRSGARLPDSITSGKDNTSQSATGM